MGKRANKANRANSAKRAKRANRDNRAERVNKDIEPTFENLCQARKDSQIVNSQLYFTM